MSSGMDLDLRSIYNCARCGTCRSVCPVFEEVGWESANARGRIMVAKGLFEGNQADADTLSSLNTCTTCGLCTEICPASVNPPNLVEQARKALVSQGIMTDAQFGLRKNVLDSGNTFGEVSPRLSWLHDRSLLKERADYVYFVGCLASYRYKETAAKTFNILKRFGVTLLQDEKCCGSPLLRTGSDASSLIKANIEQIRTLGANTAITGCSGCYTTLKNDYSAEFEVLSVPEFLAEKIDELDLKHLNISVTYHDPCHLGRHNRIFDQPRKIIKAICHLEEMKASRQDARCCGGGGGVRAGYRELSLKLARKRLQDVPDGVDYIVTSCPLCIRNLADAGAGQKVIDLMDIVAMAENPFSAPSAAQKKHI